jgi:hypothetical protein
MSVTFPIAPAVHRELHVRAARVLDAISSLGDRGEVLEAAAYLIGYESAAAGENVEQTIQHMAALMRLARADAHPAYLLAHT